MHLRKIISKIRGFKFLSREGDDDDDRPRLGDTLRRRSRAVQNGALDCTDVLDIRPESDGLNRAPPARVSFGSPRPRSTATSSMGGTLHSPVQPSLAANQATAAAISVAPLQSLYKGVPGMQPSSHGLNRTVVSQPTVSFRPRPMVASPTGNALDSPRKSILATGHSTAADVASMRSGSAEDHFRHFRGSHYSPSPRPQRARPRDASVGTGVRNAQNAAFRDGTLANAHDFTVVNPYMVDGGQTRRERRADEATWVKGYSQTEKERRAEEEKQAAMALRELAAKGMAGAMLNSKERAYAPRCNADTRRTLRGRILEWGRKDDEVRGLLWLSGPAGVGKSAVAQTVAEELKREGLLGAVFFFSRPNNRSNPDVVIPTLIYQLFLLLPDYQRIVTQKLAKDPLILNQNRPALFKDFIIDPFRVFAESQPRVTLQKPLVIVLDGLDECNDHDAQCEFVRMISRHVQMGAGSRLRWMICSRPEPDLEVTFSSAECKAICLREKLEVDDNEARRDARRILARGFAEIRQRYPDRVTQDWPDEDQIRFIADRSSGHLGFVSFIIRLIGDEYYDDPSGQLDACVKFLKRTSYAGNLDPLHALDLLYTRILSDIPAEILPVTQRILGLFILYRDKHLTVAAHANFLGLNQGSFYRALRQLHSILLIPPATNAGTEPIVVYHSSFSDYLKDPVRSEKFALDVNAVHLEVATLGLKWLSQYRKKPSRLHVPPKLTWIPPDTSPEATLLSVCKFAFGPCWEACPRVSGRSLSTLIKPLANFDYNLDYTRLSPKTQEFVLFIQWVAANHPNLITVNGWHAGRGGSGRAGEILVVQHHDEPHEFLSSFLTYVEDADYYSVHLRLGRLKPTPFRLVLGNDLHTSYFESD